MTRRPAILYPASRRLHAPAICAFLFVVAAFLGGRLFLRCRDKMHRALSAELPIKPSSRASTIAVLCSPYSRRAGHSREKTPGTLLPQCPALLPAQEARAYPSAPVGSLEYASPYSNPHSTPACIRSDMSAAVVNCLVRRARLTRQDSRA